MGKADLLIVGNDSNIVNTLVWELFHLLDKPGNVAGAAHGGVGSWNTHQHNLQTKGKDERQGSNEEQWQKVTRWRATSKRGWANPLINPKPSIFIFKKHPFFSKNRNPEMPGDSRYASSTLWSWFSWRWRDACANTEPVFLIACCQAGSWCLHRTESNWKQASCCTQHGKHACCLSFTKPRFHFWQCFSSDRSLLCATISLTTKSLMLTLEGKVGILAQEIYSQQGECFWVH